MSRKKFDIPIGKLLKEFRKGKGLSIQTVAKMLGRSPGYMSEVENGISVPGGEFLCSIKRTFPEVDLNYLATGEESVPPCPELKLAGPVKAPDIRVQEFLAVPLVEDKVAAGIPAVMSDQIEGWAVIYAPKLAKKKNLVAVRVKGDSMTPVIPDGSIVILDRDDRRIRPRSAYAIREEEGVTVKYLEREGEELVLIPENRAHRERRITIRNGDPDPIIGRVVWLWREWV